MSFWKSTLGGMLGFSIGGPIGAVIGAVIGSKLGSKGSTNVSSHQKQQAAFFTALFACLAKLAKADGVVSREEVDAVDTFIKERFKFGSEQRVFAIQVFNHAKDDSNSYSDYAQQLSALLSQDKNALMMFYELLFELAMADGTLHPEEERLLKDTITIFKLNSSIFDELKNRFDGNSSDAYKVLGVDTHTSFDEIKKIYLKKRREFHPDTLVSKGLPDELLEKAKERFIEIQQAFEEIEEKNKNNN